MTSIASFDRSMIKQYLQQRDIPYLLDDDGDFFVQFGRDEDTGLEYVVSLLKEGDIFTVVFSARTTIDHAHLGKALMACNEWNQTRRWPRAILYIDEEENTGSIRLDGHLDLEQGVHQELFNDFADYHVSGGAQFWDWVHKEELF